MCLLTYFPAGVQPDTTALANGAELNPHGHGYAVVTKQGIAVGKSFDLDQTLEQFARLRAEHPDGPALFHSRFRTHGKLTAANIHPFNVRRRVGTVLAHNGILPESVQPSRRQKRSDTRIFAEDRLGATISDRFDNLRARIDLEHWLGPWNKVVVLTVDPRYDQQAYLFNEKAGLWADGIWYSNTDFQASWPGLVGDEGDMCLSCHSVGSAGPTGICGVCGQCVECASSPGGCPSWCPRIWAIPPCGDCRLPGDECECTPDADIAAHERAQAPVREPASANGR